MSDTLRSAAPLTSRRSIGALLAVCVALAVGLAAAAVGTVQGRRSAHPAAGPAAAVSFLTHYEQPDGRVVRPDQGGDTVSEGQAYAMLVSAEIGDRRRFDAAWHWADSHLRQPDGLMAWRWAAGHVIDPNPATDADLGAADALLVAGDRFGDAADRDAGEALAGAVLTHDVVSTPSGPVLAAGPWATTAPVRVDPSYLATPELAGVASAVGGEWVQVLGAARAQLASLTASGTLPSDWAIVGGDGALHPAAPPGDPGAPVRFGYDAVRLPIWLASSCDPGDRGLAAAMLPALERGGGDVGLDLGGRPSPGSPAAIGQLALAAARVAAAMPDATKPDATATAIAAAGADQRSHPTYYAAAWLALADLGFSHRLGGC